MSLIVIESKKRLSFDYRVSVKSEETKGFPDDALETCDVISKSNL